MWGNLVSPFLFRIFTGKIKVMALWEFKNLNKHGNYRTRIVHTNGALSIPGSGFGHSVFARRFKYKYEHPVMPPTIFKNNGKTYLMPLWKEVIEGTTVEDIEWIKPKPKRLDPSKATQLCSPLTVPIYVSGLYFSQPPMTSGKPCRKRTLSQSTQPPSFE